MITFAMLPAVWVVSASLNPSKSLVGATLIPRNAGFGNYGDLINHPSYPYERGCELAEDHRHLGHPHRDDHPDRRLCAVAVQIRRQAGVHDGILVLNVFPAVLSIIALFGMCSRSAPRCRGSASTATGR